MYLPYSEAPLCRAHDTDGCRFCRQTCANFEVHMMCVCVCVFFFLFSIPFINFALFLFSLPPSGNSGPGSHTRLFSPPRPHYGSCLVFFVARIVSALFYPSSTRFELWTVLIQRLYIRQYASCASALIKNSLRVRGTYLSGPAMLRKNSGIYEFLSQS